MIGLRADGTRSEVDVGRAALFGAFASALVGFYALASAGPVGPLPIAGLAVALLAGGWRMRKGLEVARSTERGTLRTGLVTFLLALAIVPAHGILVGSWVLAAIDLLVILQANRMLALAQGRAMGQVLLLSLLMLLGAAVLTLNMSFLGAVFLFCLAGTWTAVFMTLFDPDAKGADRRVPRGLARSIVLAGLGVFVMTCALFGLLPRLRFQAFTQGLLKAEGMSGFSDEVTLGDIGSVKLDRSPVMRVELSGARVDPNDLYWRGIALDRYRGARWSVSDPSEQKLVARRRSDSNWFELRPGDERALVHQAITLEPIDVSVLFGLSEIAGVSANLPSLSRNSTDSLIFSASAYGRTHYSVDSRVRPPDEKDLADRVAAVPAQAGDPARYLQIPETLKATLLPVARELAGEGSDFQRVRRLETAMQAWKYSLTASPQTRSDPVASFVLDARSGWCEQYSSGMVLMLRALGIPARMANGFHGGEPNVYGAYWLVRKSDAHSWVEVPFGSAGWITFDPTPVSGQSQRSGSNRLMQFWDFARLTWSQRIVNYDIFDQFALVSAAGDRAQNFTEVLQHRMRALSWRTIPRLPVAAFLAGLGLLLGGRAIWARRGRPRRGRSVEFAESWWREVERSLASKGFVRSRGETPRELAARAGVRSWADLYYAVRFSVRDVTAAERTEMDRIRGLL